MCIMFSRNIEPTILKQCKRNRKSTLSHPWLHQPRSRHLPSRLLFPSRQRLCRETYGISGRTGLVEIQIELNIVRQDRSAIPCLLPPPITSRAVPRERKLFCLISSSAFLGDQLCLEGPSSFAAARELPLLSTRSFIFVAAKTKSAGS